MRPQERLVFQYNNVGYDLPLTDIEFVEKRHKEAGARTSSASPSTGKGKPNELQELRYEMIHALMTENF